ncbi:F-box/LRR-repeat protein 12 [Patella vulgata]|uniref:F-box/LRR-repeat protein 12 n=1 Tax=Patella vulgata TaxID=6465 RepID=UPI00218077D2|nr:F-box/LRR-repeat protein 12 [Patella vulgata]
MSKSRDVIKMATFNTLPDNIILDILSYLPVKDLCLTGRVNRRCRRIVRDNTLWRHVDLTPYRLDMSKMWKVIRAHFSDVLISMKIRGFSKSAGPKNKKYSMSDAMLKDLSERCPNIKILHLYQCNTDNLDCQKLPATLTTLAVRSSVWQPRWFKLDSNKTALLPQLKSLNVSGSARVDNFDIEDLNQWSNLEELMLNECYRVGQNGLTSIAMNLTKLKYLELAGTTITELSMHHISRHLKLLEKLNLSRTAGLSDACLDEISSGLTQLRYLNISGCSEITSGGIKSLLLLKHLETLDLTNIISSDTELKDIQSVFLCRVIH